MRVGFEDLDGAILLSARVHGPARDTSGTFLLDTGAGFLALDHPVAVALGISVGTVPTGVEFAPVAADSLSIGGVRIAARTPALDIDAEVVRRATGRDVLGLIGEQPLDSSAVVIDYRRDSLLILDSGRDVGLQWGDARAVVPFELAGDGKILVSARLGGSARTLTLIVDTGATKSALFAPALDRNVGGWRRWKSLRGLSAPTLVGSPPAAIVRVPSTRVRTTAGWLELNDMDAAVITSELQGMLSRASGRSIAGVLGYTFLRNYRVTLDYPRRRMLLERHAGITGRPYEYSQVGLQLERVADSLTVSGVVPGSPAAAARIKAGDVLLEVNDHSYPPDRLLEATRGLEGPPGTAVRIRLARGARQWSVRLVRRQLL